MERCRCCARIGLLLPVNVKELGCCCAFLLQLLAHWLTVAHFLHIWLLHGVQFTLIDGVLALHLHSAISSAFARDLDGLFEDATELELLKAMVSGDVCCDGGGAQGGS
jgi:hypothetical protein